MKRSRKIKRAPGARTHLQPSPLARLKASLDVWEFQAADEIRAAFCMANGLPVQRDIDLNIGLALPDMDGGQARRNDLIRLYTKWRADLRGTDALAVADAIMITERPLYGVDGDHAWRNGTARNHLVVALRHFAALRGNVPRGARDWKWTGKPS